MKTLICLTFGLLLAPSLAHAAETGKGPLPAQSGCVLTPPQKTAAFAALKALLKLEGVAAACHQPLRPGDTTGTDLFSVDRYVDRLIDARAEVRVECLQLPAGPVRAALEETLAVYTDLPAVFKAADRYTFRNREPGKDDFALMERYHLSVPETVKDPEGGYIEPEVKDAWITRMEQTAAERLRLAEKAVAQG